MELPRENRLFGGCVCLLLAVLIGFLSLLALFFWKTEGFLEGLLKFVLVETGILFIAFFLLSVIWCAFTPKWIEDLLHRRAKQALIAGAILTVVVALWLLLVQQLRLFDQPS